MKPPASVLWLSALVLLCGCGGMGNGGMGASAPAAKSLNIAGNWRFTGTPSVQGTTSVTISGSINQSGNSVSGAMHVDGSDCFDQMATLGLNGSVTGSKVSLTSVAVTGQVVTFTGNISDNAVTGTYAISGGCADGDKGNIAGIKVPPVTGHLTATFASSRNSTFAGTADVAQGGATPQGSFGFTGTASFQTSCLVSGTISSGTFPSGSFILGTSVVFEIATANGTLVFHGTVDQAAGKITGDYTVAGGACDDTGTAVFDASSPWDY